MTPVFRAGRARPPVPRPIRVAVVGTGPAARLGHLAALRAESHRVRLIAAVDPEPGRAEAFCAEHGVPAAHTSLTGMLAAERPDLVHLCTPADLHAAQTAECLRAGAWVWCEGPAGLSLAEYDLVTMAERENPGVYASAVAAHRFGSGARRLRRAAPELGRPLLVQCVTVRHRGDRSGASRRGRREPGGGGPSLGEMDLMLSVLGRWTEVRAMAGTPGRAGAEDVLLALVRFESGAVATVADSPASPCEESRLRFDFTGGTVELRHPYGRRDPGRGSAFGLWAPGEGAEGPRAVQLAALLDAMERGERPEVSGAEGRGALELATGVHASAFTGRSVLRAELVPGHPFYRLHRGEP
ncbi:Gfo/Idh/MocA family protein [Planomonospora parontospora]|uniref:Gfo/Idh/MocA family protein n=1 Tax=Planomonospora parontospora TaxID=58119 RepID=UPI00199D6D5F|nr:Gfo/Idh/MocA family oxidoreductase [Planomonospora parontospora]GGL27335.1 oxidoreductase [Planomonospora parontospora subsp. antibiotica]GII16535.1 oxidoreductase [Planomonospora parontospora subsp. antibiotica]